MAQAVNGTLVASTVATATLTGQMAGVEVVNRSQTGEIWVRLDGVAPTVAGADCFVVLGSRYFPLYQSPLATADTVVKLISSGTQNYSVEVVPEVI